MHARSLSLALACLTSFASTAAAVVVVQALAPSPVSAQQPRPDLRKAIIEVPLKRTIRTSVAPKPVLEEKVIAITADGTQKCAPGKVKWAKDFEQAKSRAASSNKPVLMFAMLGNLDDKFC